MKKFVLFIGLVMLTGLVNAQITFGVHASGILAGIRSSYYDGSQWIKFETKSRFSWKTGLTANIPVSENFSLMPQLNLLSKGAKVDKSSSTSVGGVVFNTTTKGDLKLTEIELPLYVVFASSNEHGGFFGGVGPVISYGLSGSSTSTTTFNGSNPETQVADVIFDGKKDVNDEKTLHLKSIELGAGALIGYKLNSGLFFNAHYNLGFSNITPDTDSKLKTSYIGIGIGYFFKSRK